MARPQTVSNPARTTFYTSGEVRKIIRAYAQSAGVSRNEALRRIVLEWEERRQLNEKIQRLIDRGLPNA